MKTKDLIRLLSEADPSGELECTVGASDIQDIEVLPAHYDGTLEVLVWKEGARIGLPSEARLVAHGSRVRINLLPIDLVLFDRPDLQVTIETDKAELRAHLERTVAQWRVEAGDHFWRKSTKYHARPIEIEGFAELNALQFAIVEAKFGEHTDERIPGSPIIGSITNRIAAELARCRGDDSWRALEEAPRFSRFVERAIERSEAWNGWSVDERSSYVRCLLSPYVPSEAWVRRLAAIEVPRVPEAVAQNGDQHWIREHLDERLEPFVRLWDAAGSGLILQHPCGTWYSNQVGGHSCMQRAAKGIYVPFDTIRGSRPDGVPDSLTESLTMCDWPGVSVRSGIKPEVADQVDAVFDRFQMPWLRVDRERLRLSDEAWMHVGLTAEDTGLFRGFVGAGFNALNPLPAVLTWPNSD